MYSPDKITGFWRGTYIYDAPELRPADGGGVNFEMHLTQGWWQGIFGRFSGIVSEDVSRGMPGTGTIRGGLTRGEIRFTKQMPVAHVIHDGQVVAIEDLLRPRGVAVRAGSIPHSPIYYSGTFDSDSTAFGVWRIEPDIVRVADGLNLRTTGSTGTFTLTR